MSAVEQQQRRRSLDRVRAAAGQLARARADQQAALDAFSREVADAVAAGIPVREVGAAGGVSGARASQIAARARGGS